MSKHKKKGRTKSDKQRGRKMGITVMVIALIAIGAITVVSRQLRADKSIQKTADVSAKANSSDKKYVTVKVAGREVQVDSQTGQIRPLTPQEAQQLADGLKGMLNKSTDGLVQQKHDDGSVSMDLQGRFQNVELARVNADGSVEQACVDEPKAGAAFFGIDPKLVGATGDASTPAVTRTKAKSDLK